MLLRLCYLIWEETQRCEKNPSRTEIDNPQKNYHRRLIKLESEISLNYFTTSNSDSNTSEETIYCTEPIKPVTNMFFYDPDVTLDSSPGSSDKNN